MADRKITVLDAVEETDLANDNTLIQFVNPDRALAIDQNRRGTLASVASGALRRVPDGSAATPAVRFASDPDTGLYRVGADVIGLSAGGAERLRVGASGISFDAGTHWLDDYAEGVWTPVFQFGSGGSVTMDNNVGAYQRVGNWCFVSGRCGTSATASPSGAVTIGGLPFNSRATSNLVSGATVGAAYSWATNMDMRAYIGTNADAISLVKNATSAFRAEVQGSDLAGGGGRNVILFSAAYPIT